MADEIKEEEQVEEKIKKVKEVSVKEDATKEELETATKDLSDTLSQIGQSMYQGQQTSEEKKTEAPEPSEVKDDKKGEKVEEGEVVE